MITQAVPLTNDLIDVDAMHDKVSTVSRGESTYVEGYPPPFVLEFRECRTARG